jgi:hypothetical protein
MYFTEKRSRSRDCESRSTNNSITEISGAGESDDAIWIAGVVR